MPLIGLLFWVVVLGVLAWLIFVAFHSQFERLGWFGRPGTWIRQEQPRFAVVTQNFVVDGQTGESTATVSVAGELWTASCDDASLRGQLEVGDKVTVERSDGMRLTVTGRYHGDTVTQWNPAAGSEDAGAGR